MIDANMNRNYSNPSFTSYKFSKTAQKQYDSLMVTAAPETVSNISKLIDSQKDNPTHIFVSKLTKIRKVPVTDCFCIKVADQTFDNLAFANLYEFFKAGAIAAEKPKVRFN